MIVHQSTGGDRTSRGGRQVHTVDGNGNALGQDVAIGALEGWDLALLVYLVVVGAGR